MRLLARALLQPEIYMRDMNKLDSSTHNTM